MAVLLAVLWGITQKMGTPGRTLARPQVALAALSPQQLRDQAAVRQALQALGHALPAAPAPTAAADPAAALPLERAPRLQQALAWPQEGIFALLAPLPEAVPAPASAPAAPAPAWRPAGAQTPPALVPAPPVQPLPEVSVVLAGGSAGKAVVNGHLVRVGDAVGEGLVVRSIELDKVTFAAGTQELQVHLPLQRLRVLGAFPQAQVRP